MARVKIEDRKIFEFCCCLLIFAGNKFSNLWLLCRDELSMPILKAVTVEARKQLYTPDK
jgi:hypothetical protein